jgi:hypothetical protein
MNIAKNWQCDPMTCPQNKMFGKMQDVVPTNQQTPRSEDQGLVQDHSVHVAVPTIDGSTKYE